MKHVAKLNVLMANARVGDLAMDAKGEIWFAYDAAWLEKGFALSPMPQFTLKINPFKAKNPIFERLHGVFNDALPDGWGLLLMDRYLMAQIGWPAHEVTALDRLAYIGQRAMGALEFRPVLESLEDLPEVSLGQMAEDALLVQEGASTDVLGALYLHGGSPGGARPKVTVAIARDSNHCISGFTDIPANYDHWIVKYRNKDADPESMGRIELAYAKMAKDAGIQMPESMLIPANVRGKNEDFFAVRRFDRVGNVKHHVISLGGMLELTHRAPSIDYENLLRAVGFATRDKREVIKAFRLMVFNVLAHNKDDHVKNFAFIHMDGGYKLTPAYDLTFSSGISNQHTTAINGEGRPRLSSIRQVAAALDINDADEIVNQVFAAVSAWRSYASAENVPNAICKIYWDAISGEPCFKDLGSLRPTPKVMRHRKI